MKIKVIGINGLARSGKDTLANHLIAQKGFFKDHFAYDLKYLATRYLGWTAEWEGDKTPRDRKMLQTLGTEVGRVYYANIWNAKISARYQLENNYNLHNPMLTVDEQKTLLENNFASKKSKSDKLAYAVAVVEFFWDGKNEHGKQLIKNFKQLAEEYNKEAWLSNKEEDFFSRVDEIAQQTARRYRRTLLVPDLRFEDEYQLIFSQKSSLLIQINRPHVAVMKHASEGALSNHYFDIIVNNDKNFLDFIDVKQFKAFSSITRESLKECPSRPDDIVLYLAKTYPSIDWNGEAYQKVIEEATNLSYRHLMSLFNQAYDFITNELTEEMIKASREEKKPIKIF